MKSAREQSLSRSFLFGFGLLVVGLLIAFIGGMSHMVPGSVMTNLFPVGITFAVIGAVVIVVSLIIGISRFVRSPRIKAGHCPCGYDLTGNVSGTCPECGQEAARADP